VFHPRGGIMWLLLAGGSAAFSSQSRTPVPVPAIDAVLDAFRTHPIVALGEGVQHGDETAYQFRLALIRDSRFAEIVNDVVVEFGNARYQDVMDRFTRGEQVPEETLRRVWQETTQPQMLADATIYQDFFRAVATLNRTLPEKRRLRVLLGDPPIEWEHVASAADFQKWLEQRDSFPADLIRREVLAKNRRALVVYGQMHFQRRNVMSNYDMSWPIAQTLVSLVEHDAPRSVFTIWPIADLERLEPSAASWQVPSIVALAGTTLGALDFAALRPPNEPRVSVEGGNVVPIPRDQWKSLPAEEQLDAVMNEGPREAITFAKSASSLCADSQHVEARIKRIGLAGMPPSEAERLRKECGR